MLADFDLPLLPTSVVGSHAKPSWLWTALAAARAGEYGAADLEETLEDATAIAIRDQTDAGVDVISSGEMRREDFIMGFYERIEGLRPVPARRAVGSAGYDQIGTFRAVDRLSAPGGLGIVEELRQTFALTDRPLKATCPGPLTLGFRIDPGEAYRSSEDVAADVSRIVNAELKSMVAAGARFIQIDEPRYANFPGGGRQWAELFNETTAGVDAELALHICFGNYQNRSASRRVYASMFPEILDVRAGQLVLEFGNREMSEVDLWQRFPNDKTLGLGVIDIKSYYVETPEDVAGRIRQALRFVRAEQLWINPDCGFNHTPRHAARAKLRAMVEGVRIVRRELAGGQVD